MSRKNIHKYMAVGLVLSTLMVATALSACHFISRHPDFGARTSNMGWLAGYAYRKQIPITGQSGAGTDYQVKLTVYSGSGSDSNGVVYLGGHCQDFPNDIRFTDDDGQTLLDHWLEEFDIENEKVIFWLEVKDDLGSNQDFYIYYGKGGTASDSDGDETFPFFDDFEAASLDAAKWDVLQGAVSLERSLVGGGAIHPVHRPAAQYYEGTYKRTYFVYLTPGKKVQIRYYDHDAKIVSSPTTLHTYAGLDNHGTPTILILSDGKILVFYSLHHNPLYVRKSTNAEDISAWDSTVTIDSGATTYPSPILLSNGDIWVFYRYTVSSTHMTGCYKVSADNGGSWGNRTTLIDFGDNYWIYPIPIRGGNTIHVAWFLDVSAGLEKIDVYYIYSPDNGTTWKKRDGTSKTPPIDSSEADLVYDTPVGKQTLIHDIKLDGSNNPYIAFTDDKASDPSDAMFAFYDSGWETHSICDAKQGSGIAIDNNDVCAVYVGVPVAGVSEIQKWISPDGGDTWAFSEAITDNSAHDNIHPQVVRGYQSSFKLLWHGERHYTSYTDYDYFLLSDSEGLIGHLVLTATIDTRAIIEGKIAFSYPKVLVTKAMLSEPDISGIRLCSMRKSEDENEKAGMWYSDPAADYIKFRTTRGGTNETTGPFTVPDITAWLRYKAIWGGQDDAKGYINDTLRATHASYVSGQNQEVYFWEGSKSTGVGLIDWVFVRKYNNPEPIVGIAESEEYMPLIRIYGPAAAQM